VKIIYRRVLISEIKGIRRRIYILKWLEFLGLLVVGNLLQLLLE